MIFDCDYRRTAATEEFLTELARSMGIPIDQLVFTTMTGRNEERNHLIGMIFDQQRRSQTEKQAA